LNGWASLHLTCDRGAIWYIRETAGVTRHGQDRAERVGAGVGYLDSELCEEDDDEKGKKDTAALVSVSGHGGDIGLLGATGGDPQSSHRNARSIPAHARAPDA